jgi:hypothetical protein
MSMVLTNVPAVLDRRVKSEGGIFGKERRFRSLQIWPSKTRACHDFDTCIHYFVTLAHISSK